MSERARVGFIRHNFLPPSETFIYTSMNALADAGFDVTAFALRRRSAAKFPSERVTSLDAVRGGALSAALYRATTWSPRFFAWARDVHLLHAHMGYTGVHEVRVGKYLEIEITGTDAETVRRQLDEAAHRFLSNPVIEDYRIELH